MVRLKVFLNFVEEIISDDKDGSFIRDHNKEIFPYKLNSIVKIKSYFDAGFDSSEVETEFNYDLFEGIKNGKIDWIIVNLSDDFYKLFEWLIYADNTMYLIDKLNMHNIISTKILKIEKL